MIRFCRVDRPPPGTVTFECDDRPVRAVVGETVASAMLRAGIDAVRLHPGTGEPRMPYCLMGVCFECLVEIDGVRDCRACQTLVREGMRVYTGGAIACGQ